VDVRDADRVLGRLRAIEVFPFRPGEDGGSPPRVRARISRATKS